MKKNLTLYNAAALALAAYKRSTYDPKDLVIGQIDIFENKETHIEGFVGTDDTIIIVAFAGTQDIFDWRTNWRTQTISLSLPEGGYIRIHTGFYEAYLSVSKLVEDLISKHNTTKTKKLVFTGHSQGGALAILASLEHKFANREYRTITFGCPRVGGKGLSKYLDKSILRIEARGDIVPYFPLFWTPFRPTFFYKQVGVSIRRGFYYPGFWAHSMERYMELVRIMQMEYNLIF